MYDSVTLKGFPIQEVAEEFSAAPLVAIGKLYLGKIKILRETTIGRGRMAPNGQQCDDESTTAYTSWGPNAG